MLKWCVYLQLHFFPFFCCKKCKNGGTRRTNKTAGTGSRIKEQIEELKYPEKFDASKCGWCKEITRLLELRCCECNESGSGSGSVDCDGFVGCSGVVVVVAV